MGAPMLNWKSGGCYSAPSTPSSYVPALCPSRPVTKKVTKTENFTEQSCQMYFKGDKNTFRITLMPLLCWARQS